MVSLNNVSRHYGTQDVLTQVTCEVLPGEKIGLIGPNGAGKTTLVRILVGDEEPSVGSVTLAPGTRIGHVPQHVETDPGLTVEQYMLESFHAAEARLRSAEEALAGTEPAEGARGGGAMRGYQAAREVYDGLGGDDAPRRAESLLDSLGLGGAFPRTVETLSGGERNVLSLAKAVLGRPTLLVLDEPGNHLDFDGLARLETFLQAWGGAVLVVSHNRYLLDRVVTRIFELENTRLGCFQGNYSQYRMTRLRKLVAQQADYTANQKRLARLEALVKRFAEIARVSHDPAWGRRLHSRKTQLAREKGQAVERPVLPTARISLALNGETTRADIALQCAGYTRGYGETVLFRDASLAVYCRERVALVGPNGCGKTTFLRDVVEKARWDDRTLRVGPSLRVGYCAQNQEVFDGSRTVLDELQSLGSFTRKEVYAAVSRFLFHWEDLDKRIADLSGGERNRLQLARLILLKASFLVLDEPTNHMDIASREAIEESLCEFGGTILLVSHDRYLLDKVTTRIVTIEDRSFVPFQGSFSEYWAEREHARQPADSALPAPGKRRAGRQSGAAVIEERITAQEAEKLKLEREISAAFAAGDHRRGRDLATRLEKTARLLDDMYRQWEQQG